MSCDCNNSRIANYTIEHDDGDFVIKAGSTVVSSCGGELHVNLGAAYDCAKLTFTYDQGPSDPSILPMATNGDCPCDVGSGTVNGDQVITATFKPPSKGSCTYWWTLYASQPTCRIKIVVAKS